MEQRLSVVTLGVADLEASRAFYERLEWKSKPQETIVFFPLDGMILSLYPRAALAEDAQLPDDGRTDFGGITLAYCARDREDVDRVLASAVAAGARLLKPAQDVFWGGYSGYFADPDGYPWEVAWNPYWTLDAQGRIFVE